VQPRYRYRLDPAPRHVAALARALGCTRMVFNDALRARQQAHAAGYPALPMRNCHAG
jgi:putative transposase